MLSASNKVSVPSSTSSQEEVAAFRKALGVPADIKGYEITRPATIAGKAVPDALWEQPAIDAYLGKFLELGVPKDAAQKLISYGLEQGVNRYNSLSDIVQEARAKGEKQLKADWGDKFDANLEDAERGSAAAGITAEMVKNDPVLANNATFLRAMAKVGAMLKEGPSAGARGGAPSITDPQVRINELQAIMANPKYRSSPEYTQRHAQNVEELRGLLVQKDNARR